MKYALMAVLLVGSGQAFAGECNSSTATTLLEGADSSEEVLAAFESCKAQAATDNAAAKYYLALFYFDPRFGVDEEKAVELILAAAEDGFTRAQFWMGWQHEKGVHLGPDKEAARNWYQRAADLGDRFAQERLFQAYQNGEIGLEPDAAKAQHFQTLSEQCCKAAGNRR